MKLLITGHRKSKLVNYDEFSIKYLLLDIFLKESNNYTICLSGMADGIDLWFLEIFEASKILGEYWCCVPFQEQEEYMCEEDKQLRQYFLQNCRNRLDIRNSEMVQMCDKAVVVWDGNKGGTHNVLQQLIENKKPFYWINPVNNKYVYME
jgi:uncharacterized phage-like protein YoqJ